MKFPEQYKVVPILSDGLLSASSYLDGDSINMKNFHHATFLINWQEMGGADPVLYLYSSTSNGGITSALKFNYAYGSAVQGSANCDVLGVSASSTALTVSSTKDNTLLIAEVDASDMDIANNENWLTMRIIDASTGATGNVSVVAVLEPRYTGNLSVTALA